MKPQQWAIYKGITGKNGAVQFNLQMPHYYNDRKEKDYTGRDALDSVGKIKPEWKLREGAVFIEITSAIGPNQYDWERKVTMALSVTDMGKLLEFLRTGKSLSLMHDPGAKTDSQGAIKKHLNFDSPNGIMGKEGARGGCLVRCTMTSGSNNTSHQVPMSTDECLVLQQLIQAAIPVALGWN